MTERTPVVSFAAEAGSERQAAATPPPGIVGVVHFAEPGSGKKKTSESGLGESGGGYEDVLSASHNSVDKMSMSQRVTSLKDKSVTQRFNIFQERRQKGKQGSPSMSSSMSREGLNQATAEELQQERLKESIVASKKAMRKVQHAFEKGPEICNTLFQKAMQRREDIDAQIHHHVDEYIKLCCNRSKESDSHNLHFRFTSSVDEMRLLRFELQGISEHSKEIVDRTGSILGEVYARVCHITGQILRGDVPDDISQCSPMSYLDQSFGLVVQQWETPEAVKRFGKSLSRFLNYSQCVFHTPLFIAIECCGRSFTAMTMIPIQRVIHDPMEDEWVQYFIQKATCDTHFPIDHKKLVQDCRFAFGYDGRLYCIDASGLIPAMFPDQFLETYEGEINVAAMNAIFMRNVEHTCTELTAVSRANACEVSKIVHKNGLTLQYIHHIHAYLSRTEATREQYSGNAEDQNLVDALRAVISEILSRVLKMIIREYWCSITPAEDHVMAKEMATFASQLVYSMLIEGLTEAEQLYMVVAKLSKNLFPPNKKAKSILWEEFFVSEEQIAARCARFLGLSSTQGCLAATSPYRFVRGTHIQLHPSRLEITRGKHRDILQKMVSRIKSSRAFSPHNCNALIFSLADLFHQASMRSGVTNSPSQVYEQLCSSNTAAAATNGAKEEGTDGKKTAHHDDFDDDNKDEIEIKYMLVLQAVFQFQSKKISSKELLSFLNAFLESNINLCKVVHPQIAPYFMACRVRVLHNCVKVCQESAIMVHIESTIQTLDNLVKKAREGIDPRHSNWMWRLLYNGLAGGKGRQNPEAAVEVMRTKLKQAQNTFGEDSLQAVGCVTDVATALCDVGRYEEAVEEFLAAQQELEKQDAKNRMAFTTANNLGVTYFQMASKLCPDKLKKRRQTFLKLTLPADVTDLLLKATEQFKWVILNRAHADMKQIADALNNLGSVNLFRMRYGDAIICFEDSLALTREHHSDEHPDRLQAIKNLKTCEKHMRQKAAVMIGCWVKRARAKAQLALLKKGSNHVRLFQRVGRAMFVRLQLFRHMQKRRVKMQQQQRIAAATAAAAAKRAAQQQRSQSPAPEVKAVTPQAEEYESATEQSFLPGPELSNDEKEHAAGLFQAVGRAFLQRKMLAELLAIKLKKKK